MKLFDAVVYGFIQGLTEFLPVSSSGHLMLAQRVLGAKEGCFTFDVMLHLGTLLAVFIMYSKELRALPGAFIKLFRGMLPGMRKKRGAANAVPEKDGSQRLAACLIYGSLPLAAAALLADRIEILAGYPKIIGAVLIVNGALLYFADRLCRGKKRLSELKCSGAFAVGLFQLLAIVPGLSRSGSTVTGGLLCGLERGDAVKFSFLLSVPAVLGANLFSIPDMAEELRVTASVSQYLLCCAAGMLAAALSGILAISLLKTAAKKARFKYFSYYCAAIGLAAVIFL